MSAPPATTTAMQRHHPELALHVPTLLLPGKNAPLPTWAVIACDQHTSSPAYWDETARLVGDAPSTLRLVLPEAALGAADRPAAIAAINARMADYLRDGTLVEHGPGFVRVERETGRAAPRRGLVVALDLEAFDHRPGTRTLIRSTEGTDPGRLPARVAVRRDAPLETPHVLVLIDDPAHTVIDPLFALEHPSAYDFTLMQDGGRVRGWHVDDPAVIANVAAALSALRQGDPPVLYAVGDGNHSLAAARVVWEERKAAGAAADHPARYALAELVNLHDAGVAFAPIHRLLDVRGDAQVATIFDGLAKRFERDRFVRRAIADAEQWRRMRRVAAGEPGVHIAYRTARGQGVITIAQPPFPLATSCLHAFLDAYLAAHPLAALDYIHGDDALTALTGRAGRIGFYMPGMDKGALFETVLRDGPTPRKTFSLGEAHEKRYYLECRRIRP